MNKKILYISYNGLLEPILPSQGLPYLKIFAEHGLRSILLTFEKKKDLNGCGKDNLKKMENDLRRHGIEWIRLTYHKNPKKIATLLDISIGLVVSYFILLKNKIKIIHVRGVTPGLISLLLSKIFRLKIVFDMRGLLAEEYVGGGLWKEKGLFFNFVKLIENMLLKRADAIVVLTEKHYRKNSELSYLKAKNTAMSVIPCCVDLDRFRYDENNNKKLLKKYNINSRMLLVYPGKLGTFYFLKEMIDFFKSVSSKMEGLEFLILTQDDLSKIEIDFNTKGLHVLRPSFEEIPVFLSSADAGIFFINPYKKYGSSPIKFGEFLASGRPVIINSGIGDTEEIVTDNRVGVVVNNFNNDEYLNKMAELLELLKEGEALNKRCRATAEKFLSLKMGAERYLNIYKELAI